DPDKRIARPDRPEADVGRFEPGKIQGMRAARRRLRTRTLEVNLQEIDDGGVVEVSFDDPHHDRRTRLQSLYMHRAAHAAGIAEHAQITLDLRRLAGGLFRIVSKLDRRSAVDRAHLAYDRDRVEIARTIRRAT